jgi:hypothetical protein
MLPAARVCNSVLALPLRRIAMRYLPLLCLLYLTACQDVAIKTFADATSDVNEGFALGRQLRDRCAVTGNPDHCLTWMQYKHAEESDNGLLDYDKALVRWESKGPY